MLANTGNMVKVEDLDLECLYIIKEYPVEKRTKVIGKVSTQVRLG